jgi:hypothetical protein
LETGASTEITREINVVWNRVNFALDC